jgi:hypothetical protein
LVKQGRGRREGGKERRRKGNIGKDGREEGEEGRKDGRRRERRKSGGRLTLTTIGRKVPCPFF